MGNDVNILTLNAGVSVKNLYKELDEDKIKQIEAASKGGFTEDELQKLKDSGIDTTALEENSTTKGSASKAASAEDVSKKVDLLKKKYCSNLAEYNGDIYSILNPELAAFQTALNAGMIAELGKEGFSKTQIIDIISKAFPNIGIKNKDEGGYECPKGHDEEAIAVYNKFVSELLSATGGESEEIKAARDKLGNLNKQIRNNNMQLQTLEFSITILQGEIEDSIEDAIEKSKEIVEEQKKDASDAVKKHLNSYTSSNGEMTYEEFQSNLSRDLDNLAGSADSKLSYVILSMIQAEKKMNTLNGYLSEMNSLIKSNDTLSKDAATAQDSLKALFDEQEAAGAGADSEATSTDPIGFYSGNTRYDFFVDNDNNGDITNESEFLGAKNGFSELKNMDTNNDGKVSAQELEQNNVKVIVTGENGAQQIKKASDVFSFEDSIDLKSYSAQNSDISNGNKLLGVFNVNFGNKNLDTGYQTLDTLDWLDSNFEFTDEVAGIGRFASGQSAAVGAEDFSEKYNIFSNKAQELQQKADSVWSELKIDAQDVRKNISSAANTEGSKKAKAIEEVFKKTAAEEEAAQQAEIKEKEAPEAQELEKEEMLEDELKEENQNG